MKLKSTWVAVFALGAVFAAYASGQQGAGSASSTQAKIGALQELRDSGVLSEQEYETKVNALQGGSAAPSTSAGTFVWPGVRSVEADDSQFQMAAYTLAVPSNWKFAGEIAASAAGTCHAGDRALKFTMQSPDGLYRIVMLPGVHWTVQGNRRYMQFSANQGCPPIEIVSAADFIANILLAQMQPDARIISVQGPGPGQREAMSKRYEADQNYDQMMSQRTGNPVGRITLDGVRMRIQYQVGGQTVEEMVSTVVDCDSMPLSGGGMTQSCGVPDGIFLVRAPLGQLDGFIAMREFDALLKSPEANPDWLNRRIEQNRQGNEQTISGINGSNAQYAANYANTQRLYDIQNRGAQQFNRNLIASGNRAIAADREQQDRMDHEAHEYTLYAGNQQENIDPYTGRTVVTSNRSAQQWASSDGRYTVGTQNGVNPNDYVGPGGPTFAPMTPKN
jgi:hypothetical protein